MNRACVIVASGLFKVVEISDTHEILAEKHFGESLDRVDAGL